MFRKDLKRGSVLIMGGAKSGKSRTALSLCNSYDGKEKIFLATAQAFDDEMTKRVDRHKAERGEDWLTIEEPLGIVEIIRDRDNENALILLDCLTLWLNNLFMKYKDDLALINERCEELVRMISQVNGILVIVSNEVGLGIVPENDLARVYRDAAGSLNQKIARAVQKVVAVMAGIPLVIKDE